MLAQESIAHTCSYSHDRIKAGPGDFYTVEAGTELYTDPTFPQEDALRWNDMPGKNSLEYLQAEVYWKRASETFPPEDGYSLWGEKGVTPDDIKQGTLGDCWFLASASAVAENPKTFEKIFLNNDFSHQGIYGINFWILGYPVTITIDDFLVWHKLQGWYEYNPFVSAGPDKSLWGPLIEKAFAKLEGSYETLIGGDPTEGIRYLTGAPGSDFDNKVGDEAFRTMLWEKL